MAKITGEKKEKIIILILLIITFIGAFGVCCMIHYSDGDDAFFLEQIAKHGAFFDFVSYLTKTMNGRIASTVSLWFVFKLPLLFWRVFNAVAITATTFILSKIISLFREDKECVNNYLFSLAFFGIIGIGVVGYSCLWITGSVNYLWPTCAALFAVYPILQCEYQNKPAKPLIMIIAAFSGIYVGLAQEQIAIVFMCFLAIIFVKDLIKTKKINISYAIILSVVVVAALLLLLSPFTDERTGREMRWLPEYAGMKFMQKCFITWQWFIHSFNHSLRFVMMMLWICLAIHFIVEKKYIAALIPALFTCIGAVPVFFAKALIDVGLEQLDMTKTVEHAPQFSDLSGVQLSVLLLWTAILLATLVLLIYQQKKQKNAFANVLMFLAACASCAIMLFSPSIYASGERTLFAAGVLLMMIAANIRKSVQSPKQEIGLLIQIGGVGILQLFNNADYLMQMIA